MSMDGKTDRTRYRVCVLFILSMVTLTPLSPTQIHLMQITIVILR